MANLLSTCDIMNLILSGSALNGMYSTTDAFNMVYSPNGNALKVNILNLPSGSVVQDAAFTTYTPDASTDWEIAPTFVQGALDELATRVTASEANITSNSSSFDSRINDNLTTQVYQQDSSSFDSRTYSLETAPKLVNRIIVGTTGDYTTLGAAITALSLDMTEDTEILIDAGDFPIAYTITIDLAHSLHIRGLGSDSTFLQAATGLTNKPMFIIRSATSFEKVQFSGLTLLNWGTLTTENIIDLVGDNIYCEFQNLIATQAYRFINQTGANTFFLFNGIIDSCTHAGLCSNSTGRATMDVEINTFTNCGTAIHLLQGSGSEFDIMNNIFQPVAVAQKVIEYTPATYTYTDHPSIQGNKWNNIGTFITGSDFSLASGRDANIVIQNNVGYESKLPHCSLSVTNNTGSVEVTSNANWYKANFANTKSYTCKWTIANNRITYQPTNRRDVHATILGTLSVNENSRTVNVGICKNGVSGSLFIIEPTSVRCATSGQPYAFGLTPYFEDVNAGDYFEIFVNSSNNGDDVTISDLSTFTIAI